MEIMSALGLAIMSREITGLLEKLGRHVLNRAIQRVSTRLQEEYAEAWRSHFNDCPGPLSKIWHATRCWICANNLEFDPIPLSEYIFYAFLYPSLIELKIELLFWRFKAGVFFRFIRFLEASSFARSKLAHMRLAARRLNKFRRTSKGVHYCFETAILVGLRLGKYARYSDAERKRWLGTMICIGTYLADSALRSSSDLAIIRRSLKIEVRNRRSVTNPDAAEIVEVGRRAHLVLKQLHGELRKIDGMLAEIRTKVDMKQMQEIDELRKKIGIAKI